MRRSAVQGSHRLDTTSYLPFLEGVLTPGRLDHSLGVMREMEDLMQVYALDRDRAPVTGLLHDAAKDLRPEQLVGLVEEAAIKILHPCEWHPLYLHGPVSAYLVCRELEITDPVILETISMHTYYGGGTDFTMPMLWCLRFADLLEPTREWPGIEKLREMVYAGEMEKGALLQTGWLIELFEENDTPVHPNMIRVHQELLSKLNADENFFRRW